MGKAETTAGGGFTCITPGCNKPARAKTRPGKCQACQSKESWHRKYPDAPYREQGHWGKHIGKTCEVDGCDKPATTKGKCTAHYNKDRHARGLVRKKTADESRNSHYKHRYGITLDDYNALLEQQGGVCAICGEPPSPKNTRAHWNNKLCVDHCHDGGHVRALLCNDCNLAVGYTKTRATALAIAEYFRIHNDDDSGDTASGG